MSIVSSSSRLDFKRAFSTSTSINAEHIEKRHRNTKQEDLSPLGLEKLSKLTDANVGETHHINKDIMQLVKDVDILKLADFNVKNTKLDSPLNKVYTTSHGKKSDAYFESLSRDLGTGKFKFQPLTVIYKVKNKPLTRPVKKATPKERIVHEAIKLVLTAIFDSSMSSSSFAYRPEKGKSAAV